MTDLRKKHEFKITSWVMLGSIFNSVIFFPNFTTCGSGLLPKHPFIHRSILLSRFPRLIPVLSKMEHISLIPNGRSKMVDDCRSFFDNNLGSLKYILGHPGAVSRVGRKGGTKVFKYW